jgi:hypothetical protein
MEDILLRIRNMTIPQLKALKLMAESANGIASYKEISDTTGTSSYTLGAILTSLKKYKTDQGSLILPAGRDPEGMRWQLNEKVISKDDLMIQLNELGI